MDEKEKRQPSSPLPPAMCQVLTQRAATDVHWAEYLLLINACGEICAHVPTSAEACDVLNVEEQLGEDLTRLARAIERILPGGLREFRSYLSNAGSRTP